MIDKWRAEFRRFAELREAQPSPLYRTLAAQIAADPTPYRALLAAIPANEQAPNLLFAAVHYRLSERPAAPLADFYASLRARPEPPDERAARLFREFCARHREALLPLLQQRRTQTNEVRRGLLVWPAVSIAGTIARRAALPLALLELGCSAGLNLLCDQYAYRYEDENGVIHRAGNACSALELDAQLRGPLLPPLNAKPPAIHSRIGSDLNPIDIHDEGELAWLKALVWPEHRDRRHYLEQAIGIARSYPPLDLRRGDALQLLPTITAALPANCAPLIFHTYLAQQLPPPQRARLPGLIAACARRFPLAFHLWHERGAANPYPELKLRQFAGGELVSERLLAYAEAHARWLEWRDAAPLARE